MTAPGTAAPRRRRRREPTCCVRRVGAERAPRWPWDSPRRCRAAPSASSPSTVTGSTTPTTFLVSSRPPTPTRGPSSSGAGSPTAGPAWSARDSTPCAWRPSSSTGRPDGTSATRNPDSESIRARSSRPWSLGAAVSSSRPRCSCGPPPRATRSTRCRSRPAGTRRDRAVSAPCATVPRSRPISPSAASGAGGGMPAACWPPSRGRSLPRGSGNGTARCTTLPRRTVTTTGRMRRPSAPSSSTASRGPGKGGGGTRACGSCVWPPSAPPHCLRSRRRRRFSGCWGRESAVAPILSPLS